MEYSSNKVRFIFKKEMNGWPFLIRYFDDAKTVYIPENMKDQIKEGNTTQLVTLSYRKGQKDIDEIIKEINKTLVKLPPGTNTKFDVTQLKNKNPDANVIVSPKLSDKK